MLIYTIARKCMYVNVRIGQTSIIWQHVLHCDWVRARMHYHWFAFHVLHAWCFRHPAPPLPSEDKYDEADDALGKNLVATIQRAYPPIRCGVEERHVYNALACM